MCVCLQLECCGSASYEDWYDIDWSGSGVSQSVPLSCCNHTATATQCATDDIYPTVCYVMMMMMMMMMMVIINVLEVMVIKALVGAVV